MQPGRGDLYTPIPLQRVSNTSVSLRGLLQGEIHIFLRLPFIASVKFYCKDHTDILPSGI